MQLLISVANPREADAAIVGGADIIDAKEPLAGPLGAVLPHVLREIVEAVALRKPISVALGDAPVGRYGEGEAERIVLLRARDAARDGADYVKLGFAGTPSPERAASFLAAARRGAHGIGEHVKVVAVAYADAGAARSVPHDVLLDVALQTGCAGVLIDTFDKSGGGLFDLLSFRDVAHWVQRAERAGLIPALAGKLDAEGVSTARTLGAHIAGVRGAACRHGRNGSVSPFYVRLLREATIGLKMPHPALAAEWPLVGG